MKLRFMVALCAFFFSTDLLSITQSAVNKQQKDENILKPRHSIVWTLADDYTINAEPPTYYKRAARGYDKAWDQLEAPCDSKRHSAWPKVNQAESLQKLKRYGDDAILIRPGKRFGITAPMRDITAPNAQ